MAVTIARTAWTDDDGSGTTGTVINNAVKTELYNQIDAALVAMVTASGGDAWITPTFAAGNFTGNGSMTWTVEAGDVATFAYRINGKTMTVAFVLDTTTIGGTANFILFITIPAGKVAAKTMSNPVWILNNGTYEIGRVSVAASGTSLNILRPNVANFALSTNNNSVYGFIAFEIQ
jgi:hypothetical protein